MWMSDVQIRASYRNARYKAKQVKILAELNGCPESSIYAILESGKSGAENPFASRAVELYKTGMTASEVAESMGASVYRVRYYLDKFNIKKEKRT